MKKLASFNIATFSIKRPIFITSIVLLLIFVGLISFQRLGVDMFPNVDVPVVAVTTTYKGASSEEIENLVSKPMEDEFSSVSGLKKITSTNREGVSVIVAEFTLDTDSKYAEQQMRDKLALVKPKLPDDIDEPTFQVFDPSNTPVLRLGLQADLPPAELYDLAKETIKPMLEQINNIGAAKIIGGTRREIQIELDRNRLNSYSIPAFTVANQIKSSGADVPVGKYDRGPTETVFRSVGEYTTLRQIENSLVSFSGDIDNSIAVKHLGTVRDGTEDAKNIAYIYYPEETKDSKEGNRKYSEDSKKSRQGLFIDIYKQSGSNTVAVSDAVIKKLETINRLIGSKKGNPKVLKLYDNAKGIRANVAEVKFSIIIGIILAVVVVYLFLGNLRSTIITTIAIPNSLLGAFILMYMMGFTINIMTLMALSLTVGLLVDDAIVVRENIFRKLETGLHSFTAAEYGTKEVMLAVIATTLTIIAVFFPIGFLQGMVGRFFKEFGFTVVFAMIISLFDALAVAPFLSAYFAGEAKKATNFVVQGFERGQQRIEHYYGMIINFSINKPLAVIGITSLVFILSMGAFKGVKKTFMPDSDFGEFIVSIELPPETSLDGTREVIKKIEEKIKTTPNLRYMTSVSGGDQGESNLGTISIFMVPREERTFDTNEMKQQVRAALKDFAYAKPKVNNFQLIGYPYPFYLVISGDNLDEIEAYSNKLMPLIKKIPELTEVNSSSEAGKPEYHITLDTEKMHRLGVLPKVAGAELRYHVAGEVVGKLHQNDIRYDIRLRLRPEQRNLITAYRETKVPNVSMKMIPVSTISKGEPKKGPTQILRLNRSRNVQIYANLVPGGAIGNATEMAIKIIEKEAPPPKGITYSFIGQGEDFKDLVSNIMLAFLLSLVFIYLVLASLYESFITPVTILLALPPALSGAFIALFVMGEYFNMFSMIGVVMLMGIVTKNSILLVDFALDGVRSGLTRKEAIERAGKIRLRPILMTTVAMIAGTFPLALGIGEAAKFRSAMGVAIIGGLIVSTLITLVVVPAVFEYIDIFREWVESKFRPANIPKEYLYHSISDDIEDKVEHAHNAEKNTGIISKIAKKLKKGTSKKKV